jgi:hypothetical protein
MCPNSEQQWRGLAGASRAPEERLHPFKRDSAVGVRRFSSSDRWIGRLHFVRSRMVSAPDICQPTRPPVPPLTSTARFTPVRLRLQVRLQVVRFGRVEANSVRRREQNHQFQTVVAHRFQSSFSRAYTSVPSLVRDVEVFGICRPAPDDQDVAARRVDFVAGRVFVVLG